MEENKKTWEKIKERVSQFSFNSHFWMWFFILIAIVSLWLNTPDFFNLSIPEQEAHERYAQIVRNRGWFLWMLISFSGLGIGVWLTIWGRKIQNKQWETQNKIYDLQHASHLHDRYEKASNMLGSEVMAVRVAGCRALMSLGMDDKNMKVQCVRLLFSFIRNPYLDEKEKEIYKDKIESLNKNEVFQKIFPISEDLRDDIQEAADSFSAIYDKYGDKGIDSKLVKLPDYFLKNTEKNNVTLTKAILLFLRCKETYLPYSNLQGSNLKNTDLEEAKLFLTNLREVNFQGVNLKGTSLQFSWLQRANLTEANLENANLFNARLQKANLKNANFAYASFIDARLSGANITGADMHDAIALTKEQVLSAVWGYDEEGEGVPPSLPEELLNDPEVQKWLATPHFDKRENKDS